MAITIDWSTLTILVPKADMTVVQMSPTEIRELDVNVFRLALKDLEDTEEGMVFPITHNHNPPVSLGGVTLARVVEILDPYTISFEDDQYAVNLLGANNNIADKTNVNQVSIRSSNSAGLITTNTATIDSIQLDELHKLAGLQVAHPMTVTSTGRIVADIEQTFTGEDPVTVQRL